MNMAPKQQAPALWTPENNQVVKTLVANLREELGEHFSFSPKSEERLTEVLLGTLGHLNGRQQWEEAAKAQAEARARAEQYEKDNIVIRWGIDDFEELRWGASLTNNERRKALAIIKHDHDAEVGVSWETLEQAAEKIIEKRHFVIAGAGGKEFVVRYYSGETHPAFGTYVYGWYDETGNEYRLHWNESLFSDYKEEYEDCESEFDFDDAIARMPFLKMKISDKPGSGIEVEGRWLTEIEA